MSASDSDSLGNLIHKWLPEAKKHGLNTCYSVLVGMKNDKAYIHGNYSI